MKDILFGLFFPCFKYQFSNQVHEDSSLLGFFVVVVPGF